MEETPYPPTPDQLRAIEHSNGPCLVVAGAGTGKTRVITERIARLITELDIKPESILALTFTEKAAGEMQERLDVLLPYGVFGVTTATFHGFCNELLRRHSYKIGLDPNARLIGGAEQVSILRTHYRRLPLKLLRPPFNPVRFLRSLVTFVEKAKEERITPEHIREWASKRILTSEDNAQREEGETYNELAACYETIVTLYNELHVLTYADLLTKTLELFQTSPLALKEEQERFRYISIDEFQDTNTVQAEIAYLLADKHKNIFVVGDDDQSIYRFRGANITNILHFTHKYPTAPLITLRDNFRSTQPILDASYRLITHNNPHRLEAQQGINKQLISHKDTSTPVTCHRYISGTHEAEAIAETISSLLAQDPELKPEEIAILARGHSHLDAFEQELHNLELPVHRLKEGSFYEQPSVEAALSFLRFLVNPELNSNLFYLLSGAPFDVPISDLREANIMARRETTTLWKYLNRTQDLSPELTAAVAYLSGQLDALGKRKPSIALRQHVQESKWNEKLYEAEQHVATNHLNTLMTEIKNYEVVNRPATLAQYLHHVDDLKESGDDVMVEQEALEVEPGVNLMTIHASKGLEFKVVFVVNMVMRRFPGSDKSDPLSLPDDLIHAPKDNVSYEEERRLAYVALTRAKERLFLTLADRYGTNKTSSKASVFITEALGETSAPPITPWELRGSLSRKPSVRDSAQKGMPMPQKFTASELEAFEDNPAGYLKQHVYKIMSDPETSVASSFGSCIHAVLRAFFTAQKDGIQDFDLEETYKRHWVNAGFEDEQNLTEAYERGLTAIAHHIEHERTHQPPERVEYQVEFTYRPKVSIRGTIDRLDRNEDGSLCIIDYKTGQKDAKPADVTKNLPLAIYALALEERGEKVSTLCLNYILKDNAVTVPWTEKLSQKTRERIDTILDEMNTAYETGVFPEKKTWY